LKKGAKVLVEGRLDYDPKTGGPKTWEGQDGTYHTGFGLVAQTVRFLSPKGEISAQAETADGGSFGADAEADIPF
jgi:single-stranded DNA-binding protein